MAQMLMDGIKNGSGINEVFYTEVKASSALYATGKLGDAPICIKSGE